MEPLIHQQKVNLQKLVSNSNRLLSYYPIINLLPDVYSNEIFIANSRHLLHGIKLEIFI